MLHFQMPNLNGGIDAQKKSLYYRLKPQEIQIQMS